LVSGKPKIQKQMSTWYQMYRLPPGATVRYQYSIFDSVQTERATLSAEEASSMSRAMPRLDMLVILPGEIRLVELKPNAQLKDVGQVLQYERYLMRDIFLKPHLGQPIKRVLCSMMENSSVRAACAPENIEYIVIPQSELPPPIE
jgi:hypothetical protein